MCTFVCVYILKHIYIYTHTHKERERERALVHPDFRSVDVETQVKALEVPMDLVEAFLGGAMGDPRPNFSIFCD